MVSLSSGSAGSIAALFIALTLGFVVTTLWLRFRFLHSEAQTMLREAETERLRDEIWQARESEERYRGLIEGQNDLILRRDQEDRIVYANPAFLEAAGPNAAVIGKRYSLKSTFTGEALLTSDGVRSFDQEIETDRGSRWISWVETTVREPDGRMLRQSVGRDVTERRRSEEALASAQRKAEAASAAKSRFLATVSHELRTPLSGITGMADLLLDTGLTPEQATYARAVKSSGESLLFLIDEILDFSKIESGKLELADEDFDLTALVEGVAELLAPRAQGKGIEIASFIAPHTPRQMRGDPARLRQILLNLAGNAVKFTTQGGVGITVSVSAQGKTVFKVVDTGEGVSANRQGRIFEEFEHGEGSGAGAGLGLAISRRLVEKMSGSLGVESAPGEGATFTAEIPLVAIKGETPPQRCFPAGSRALVVARSPFQAPYLCEKLHELGFEVDQAVDASHGLAVLSTSRAPLLLVVDAAIGEEAARALAKRATEAGTASRMMLLSPFERRQFGPPAAFGFDGYLVKPIRERSLKSRLIEPIAPAPCGEGRPLDAKRTLAIPPFHVLLAEDDEVNALLATRLLEREGAKVDRYHNGLSALEAAMRAMEGKRPNYDFALLDIRMPGLDGNEVARRLRKEEARLGRVPLRLVALTANALQEDRAMALAAGFDVFLVKPVLREDLVRLLVEGGTKSKVA
ncbi:MAG: response regulator [Hyphomicrobiales bacterium]|nr:response regulator [Hyphomicrobiales bacterium]